MIAPFHLAFPFRLRHGVEVDVDQSAYVEQLIEAILFTVKGERVNLPSFGCGLQQIVFMPVDSALVPATLFIVKSELQRFLAGVATIEDVAVATEESRLLVDVRYTLADSPRTRLVRYAQAGPR